MKWEMKEARFGDIVRVPLGTLYHYGIFVSEDEVIQFGLPPTPNVKSEDVEVLSAPVSDFLAGGFLEVGCPEGHEKKSRRSPRDTVAEARKRLGERGYDILHNNCEHFANQCAFGEKFSSMTENLRAKFRAIPVVHVYVASFPFGVESDKIFPAARAKAIESCSNPKVRQEKYYAWKLLENALMHSFGLKIKELNIKQSGNGKWQCDSCCFSLSHSENFVAVAVSRKPIGVDIELCDSARFTYALAEKITTRYESDKLTSLGDLRGVALNALWTKKEAIFKLLGDKAFQPKNIEASQHNTVTKIFKSGERQFFVTVASEDAAQAVFRSLENLEFTTSDF